MARQEIDDNPFKPEDNLKVNDWSPLDLFTATRNVCNKVGGKAEVLPIVTERSGQKFNSDPVSMVNQVVNYDSSSLDAKIYKQCAAATVQIKGYDSKDSQLTDFGSGAIIDKSGLVVTNHHVIENMTTPYVCLNDGRVYKLKRYRVDTVHDLELLKIDGGQQSYPYLKLADSGAYPQATVRGIGHPLGVADACLSAGTVAEKQLGREWEMTLNQHFEQGDSGSPEINEKGEMVGVRDAMPARKLIEIDQNKKPVKSWSNEEWLKQELKPAPGHEFEWVDGDKYHSLAVKIEYVKALRDSVSLSSKAFTGSLSVFLPIKFDQSGFASLWTAKK